MLGPNLATCQQATWAENAENTWAVNFELKLSNKNGRGKKQKRGGSGVGDTTK